MAVLFFYCKIFFLHIVSLCSILSSKICFQRSLLFHFFRIKIVLEIFFLIFSLVRAFNSKNVSMKTITDCKLPENCKFRPFWDRKMSKVFLKISSSFLTYSKHLLQKVSEPKESSTCKFKSKGKIYVSFFLNFFFKKSFSLFSQSSKSSIKSLSTPKALSDCTLSEKTQIQNHFQFIFQYKLKSEFSPELFSLFLICFRSKSSKLSIKQTFILRPLETIRIESCFPSYFFLIFFCIFIRTNWKIFETCPNFFFFLQLFRKSSCHFSNISDAFSKTYFNEKSYLLADCQKMSKFKLNFLEFLGDIFIFGFFPPVFLMFKGFSLKIINPNKLKNMQTVRK